MTQLTQRPAAPANVPVLTVSQLTGQVRGVLESDFAGVWVSGEITQVSFPPSGHVYFTLKDPQPDVKAVIEACMWKTSAARLTVRPAPGQEVLVRGRVTFYPPQGRCQFVAEELQPKGVGAHELALRRLKEKLQKLGYFAPERKRPIPIFPRRIAVAASPIGAAVRDILEILQRRWPCAEVWVLPVRVQGQEAPDSIAMALNLLNRMSDVDVVILGRGGGSSDDLSAFNDERVATAIYRCKFPLISAVGHEIDVTIADLVADVRALTPSEAAERATPDRARMIDELRSWKTRFQRSLHTKLRHARQRFDDLAGRRVFRFPLERVRERERTLDDLAERLQRAMKNQLTQCKCDADNRAAQLASLSPLNVLARGYSLTRSPQTRDVVRSVGQVGPGDAVEIVLHDGTLSARVEAKSENPPSQGPVGGGES